MNTIFIIIGVLALIALIVWGSLQLMGRDNNAESVNSNSEQQEDSNPLLNESQENTLEAIGVEPETLPTEITPAMQVCFVEKLGAERAQEIADGDSPTPGDYLKAKACLSL